MRLPWHKVTTLHPLLSQQEKGCEKNKSACIWRWPHSTATHPSAQQTSWQALSLEAVEREQHLAVGNQLNWKALTFLVPFTSNYIWSVGTALTDCLPPASSPWRGSPKLPHKEFKSARLGKPKRLNEHLTPCAKNRTVRWRCQPVWHLERSIKGPDVNQSTKCLPMLSFEPCIYLL